MDTELVSAAVLPTLIHRSKGSVEWSDLEKQAEETLAERLAGMLLDSVSTAVAESARSPVIVARQS